VWDYYYKQNDPTLPVKVTEGARLTSFDVQTTDNAATNGRLVTVGAADGSATLMELCEGLYQQQPNEKQTMSQIFDRETRREKNLEAAAKDARNAAKRAKRGEQLKDATEEKMAEVEKTFMNMTVKSGATREEVSPPNA
jgi:dynein intermediate chain 2